MIEEKYSIDQPERNVSQKEYPEIRELKDRLGKLAARLEKERTSEEKEKIVKEEIKSYIQETQRPSSFAPPVSARDETEEIKKFEPDQQIGALISLVFEKGLPQAISVAKDLGNPAILDEFHDALTDRYFQMLGDKKILQ